MLSFSYLSNQFDLHEQYGEFVKFTIHEHGKVNPLGYVLRARDGYWVAKASDAKPCGAFATFEDALKSVVLYYGF